MHLHSVLSPLLFNFYLDAAIATNEVLKNMAECGKLFAYADDLFIITDNKQEAEAAIAALT